MFGKKRNSVALRSILLAQEGPFPGNFTQFRSVSLY